MTRQRPSSPTEHYQALLALCLFVVLTVVMTWPVAARLGTHVPGGTVDLWTHRWTYWWIKYAITQGQNPFYTHLLFHPRGVSLAFHNVAWVNIAVWLPLQAVLGGNTAYGLTFLIFCVANCFSMYLLVHEYTNSFPGALVGGMVYGFWPYMLSQFGHPNMKVVCWVPLTLLYLRRTIDGRRLRDALLAGLFLALTGLTRWQLLLMAAIVFALYLAYEYVRDRAGWNLSLLGMLALAGLAAGVLMAPLAVPVASALLGRDDATDVLFTEEISKQTDVLAYVLPTRYHPLWNENTERLHENLAHNKVYVPFLGYTVLALGSYGAVKRWKQARFWLVVAAVYVALALGPQLRVNGQLFPSVPMPYRLLGDTFVVRAVRVPHRFNLFLGLPMAMVVSLGVVALTHRRSWKAAVLLTAVLGALILREYSLVPYHTERPLTPAWYDELANDEDQFAVLDLPIELRTYNKQYMFYQITHRKPLVEGKVARPPREAFAFVESSRFLKQLDARNVMDPALVNVSSQLGTLADANVRYIILHKDFATSGQLAAWRDWLTFDPLHEDEDLVVYSTDPQLNRDFVLTYKLTDNVGLLRASAASTETIQGAVVHVDARWGSAAPPERDYEACLALVGTGDEVAQTQCMPLSPSWPTSRWNQEEIVRGRYAVKVGPTLEPAEYALRLTLADGASGEPVGESVTLGRVEVDSLQPTQPLHVRLGAELLLQGYDLTQSHQALELTLYWEAQRKMEISYKVFVHLVDPTSDEILVQDDAVPRRWKYPTTEWQAGEVVRDIIPLSLEGLTPGQYHVRIGCYDPATGHRLAAYNSDGKRYEKDVVPLTSIEIE
ncbi:MAG: hypothetical protein PVJ55_01950 [Anaerolineae bacterium]